jgi:hypothetical protein
MMWGLVSELDRRGEWAEYELVYRRVIYFYLMLGVRLQKISSHYHPVPAQNRDSQPRSIKSKTVTCRRQRDKIRYFSTQ